MAKGNGRWHIGEFCYGISDAVYCALEIQEKTKKEASFLLRIGIHLGEVVFEKGDVFGDGVNIASRIQSIAAEGEIVVSESVYRNIANKKGLEVEFLREETLKNVEGPIKIYQVKLRPDINPELINFFTNQPIVIGHLQLKEK
ncbi:MAG TPA: adenylate/guanylate cyclase domain-containing protein [Chitinophagaceae bacterium]|nr:adenylate/guanylate cyclase domain-containing protein [Chitinophagaceae bacterium]